jgi:hypothetical protein
VRRAHAHPSAPLPGGEEELLLNTGSGEARDQLTFNVADAAATTADTVKEAVRVARDTGLNTGESTTEELAPLAVTTYTATL